jgi:hypothetical protein
MPDLTSRPPLPCHALHTPTFTLTFTPTHNFAPLICTPTPHRSFPPRLWRAILPSTPRFILPPAVFLVPVSRLHPRCCLCFLPNDGSKRHPPTWTRSPMVTPRGHPRLVPAPATCPPPPRARPRHVPAPRVRPRHVPATCPPTPRARRHVQYSAGADSAGVSPATSGPSCAIDAPSLAHPAVPGSLSSTSLPSRIRTTSHRQIEARDILLICRRTSTQFTTRRGKALPIHGVQVSESFDTHAKVSSLSWLAP